MYSGAHTTNAEALIIKSESEPVSGDNFGSFSNSGVYTGQFNVVRSTISESTSLDVKVSLNRFARMRFFPEDAARITTLATIVRLRDLNISSVGIYHETMTL